MARRQQQQLLISFASCSVILLLAVLANGEAEALLVAGTGNHFMEQQHNSVTPSPDILTSVEDMLQSDDYDIKLETPKNRVSRETNDQQTEQPSSGDSLRSSVLIKRSTGEVSGLAGKEVTSGEDLEGGSSLPWEQDSLENDVNAVYDANQLRRRFKKAPTAFYGVRGKKFGTAGTVGGINDLQRWRDFLENLEEEHMHNVLLQDFLERLTSVALTANDVAKRAPIGFTGVRGKRPTADEEAATSVEAFAKRGLNNAFVGVRGKKDVAHQNFKRSLVTAQSRNGGKRQRFIDFSNKFVAVRGKKDSVGNRQTSPYDYVSGLPSIRFLYGFSNKRAPSGFLGMRGKRPTDEIMAIN